MRSGNGLMERRPRGLAVAVLTSVLAAPGGAARAEGHLDAPLWIPDPSSVAVDVRATADPDGGAVLSSCWQALDPGTRYEVVLRARAGGEPARVRFGVPDARGSRRVVLVLPGGREVGEGVESVPPGPAPITSGGQSAASTPAACHPLAARLSAAALALAGAPRGSEVTLRAVASRERVSVRPDPDRAPAEWIELADGSQEAVVLVP